MVYRLGQNLRGLITDGMKSPLVSIWCFFSIHERDPPPEAVDFFCQQSFPDELCCLLGSLLALIEMRWTVAATSETRGKARRRVDHRRLRAVRLLRRLQQGRVALEQHLLHVSDLSAEVP